MSKTTLGRDDGIPISQRQRHWHERGDDSRWASLKFGSQVSGAIRLQQSQLGDFWATEVVLGVEQQSAARTKQHQPCGIETTMIKMSRMIECNFIALS